MKICIATFYNIPHPGAVLQAYALCKTLNSMGHDARLIKYPLPEEPKRPSLFSLEGVYDRLSRSMERSEGYAHFVTEFCPETSLGYASFSELKNYPPDADAYICGSDQIWNPKLTGGSPDPAYFLDYGGDGIKRISYAASHGGNILSDAHKVLMKGWLERFEAFSVREKEGKELIHELTGKDVALVVDPTLLIEDWKAVASPMKSEGSYVLLYQLQKSPQVHAAAQAVAKRLGKTLLNIEASPKFWTRPGRDVRPPSPREWLGLFQNAAAVVTNSFHGTVFSILFNRPFYSVSLTGEKAKRAGRMKDLCDQLGLGERFVSGDEQLLFDELDWITVNARLKELRASSLQYLEQALAD